MDGKNGWLKSPNYRSFGRMPKIRRMRAVGSIKWTKNSIQILREDFQALSSTHTTAIGNLHEELKEDELLLMLEIEKAFKETT